MNYSYLGRKFETSLQVGFLDVFKKLNVFDYVVIFRVKNTKI